MLVACYLFCATATLHRDDGGQLDALLDRDNLASGVWADGREVTIEPMMDDGIDARETSRGAQPDSAVLMFRRVGLSLSSEKHAGLKGLR